MPLVIATLLDGLNDFLANPIGASGYGADAIAKAQQQAADAWAKLYVDYASQASPSAAKATNLPPPNLLSVQFLAAMQAGAFLDLLPVSLAQFWLAMPEPVAFAGALPGVVTASNLGTGNLTTAINTVKTAGMAGGSDMATLAAGIHAFTLAVVVTFTSPAGPILTPLT